MSERGEKGRKSATRYGPCTAPVTPGRDFSSARSAMADTSMIPSVVHAAGSHPWATSSPSVEIRVLSTSGAALSHRACDLNMAVSSHRLYFKLHQLTSSAPRRILPTFLTRNNTCVMMHNAHTKHFKVVANKYAYNTSAIFPAVFTYICILIALRNVVF